MTLFIVASPVIAMILFVLLLRQPKNQRPDPGDRKVCALGDFSGMRVAGAAVAATAK